MYLIVTIDTEEDNWSAYSNTDNSVENIARIPDLNRIFDEYGVKPTYLVTYPVAINPRSIDILGRILQEGKCEIGAHCHPWNTPPFEEELNRRNTMMCNLPANLVYRKMSVLHEAIQSNLGITPASFRPGRWGFGPGVARALWLLGYRVDSSVTPYVDWSASAGPDFSEHSPDLFRFCPSQNGFADQNGSLLEVPVSIGFTQANFAFANRVLKTLKKVCPKKFHLIGVLKKLRLLNLVWLSPEASKSKDLRALANRLKKNGHRVLNFTFHSGSLVSGLTPFSNTKKGSMEIMQRIENFLMYARDSGFQGSTLSGFESDIRVCHSRCRDTRSSN
jgi:peptidoglycan/xylan/chitin deacetylase (PgdA/CDA1 family)